MEIKRAIRDPVKLCRVLGLPEWLAAEGVAASADFPLFAPRPFVERMERGNPRDPLLLQLLPAGSERQQAREFCSDPTADTESTIAPGVIQKYAGRVLLITTGACAIHCRYCFRRHYPYSEVPVAIPHWERSLQAIRGDASIREVILSGGDPLMIADSRLVQMMDCIERIPHVDTLRIHTRLPIMIPGRVNDALLQWIERSRLNCVIVLHSNHAREIDAAVAGAVEALLQAGCMLLNQSVLLAGINDTLAALVDLSQRLIQIRVMPYYLHQLDRVQGAAHFEVDPGKGRELVAKMLACLPGYAVPRYVREVPGAMAKTPLFPSDPVGPPAG